MAPTVLPVASRALLEACRRLGLDPDALRAAAGIAPGRLEDPDARLDAAQADGLWRAAFERSRDPHLALRAAGATPFGAFRTLDYLGVSGETLGEGLRRVAEYFPIVDPRGRLRVEEAGAGVALAFAGADGSAPPPPAQEYTLGVLHGRARHAGPPGLRLLEVRFAFPAPSDAAEHGRVFGVAPRFGAGGAALVFSRADWESPTRLRDPVLFALLDRHARALARGAGAGEATGRTRAAIADDLPGREPTLVAAARRLALSPRTLQRRLKAEGTSFARLVDEVRRERAEAFLAAGDVAIAEVSWLLGFSEQSAFTRAFRRWTGRSPSRFRRGS